MWTVYCHENCINGKRYVGITSQDIIDRWRDGDGYKSCSAFYNAIEKYGWDNFDHIILFDDVGEEFAKKKEIELISLFNCKVPNGYNITDGGDGTLGREVSPETREKMRTAKIGKYDGENNPMYGVPSPNKGKHLSEETKQKIRDKKLGKKKSIETKKKFSNGLKNYYASHSPHRWVTNGIESLYVNPEEVDFYLSIGYRLGRKKGQ